MIPIYQTRHGVETFGNCYEACLASILELPLAAIPDRTGYFDVDAWADRCSRERAAGRDPYDLPEPGGLAIWEADLDEWLNERGLGLLALLVGRGGISARAFWRKLAPQVLGDHGYAIASYRDEGSHAVVVNAAGVAHNPHRGADPDGLGKLTYVYLLVAADPPKIARRLDPLPDVAAALEDACRP